MPPKLDSDRATPTMAMCLGLKKRPRSFLMDAIPYLLLVQSDKTENTESTCLRINCLIGTHFRVNGIYENRSPMSTPIGREKRGKKNRRKIFINNRFHTLELAFLTCDCLCVKWLLNRFYKFIMLGCPWKS